MTRKRSHYTDAKAAVDAVSPNPVSITAVPFPLGTGFFAVLCALVVAFALLLAGTAHARCRTHRCWHKVSVRRHIRYAWGYYRAHPMPYCTWAYESGTFGSPWRASRYFAKNPSSTAGGKFQILDQTWFAYGGRSYASDSGHHVAAYAPPLEQEKIARRILAGQGVHAWSRC